MEASAPDQEQLSYIFVPTPGDHYSPQTGSANITRIYEISRRHIAAGGQAKIIVCSPKKSDYPTPPCVETPFHRNPTPRERQVDAALGWLGLGRRFRRASYRPVMRCLDPRFSGVLFWYNHPAVSSLFRRRLPHARLCLYCGNRVFRTFGARELKAALSATDHVICISQFLADDLRAKIRASCGHAASKLTQKISAIPNGVDLDTFRPAAQRSEPDVPVVLFVGRVVPDKGPHLLIQAAQKLSASGRRFRLRIVGSDEFSATNPLSDYEIKLRQMAAPLGETVIFEPFVDRTRIGEAYRRADIFCVPSTWDEPFGMTLLEGMACGLPTIAARRGGLPEAGDDDVLYFHPPNVEELARQLAFFLDDPSAQREWGRRARTRAELFSWDRHYSELRHVLSDNPCD